MSMQHLNAMIRATPRHVDRTLNASTANAVVCQNSKVIRTQAADPNAF